MTREEAIEVFKTEHPYNPDRKDNDLHTLAKAFDMAISALSVPEREKGKWIPTTERLPEIEQDVLLSLRSLDVEVGFKAYTKPYFYCHGADYIKPQNVLAWMPLPEPYKAESEDKE